MDQPTGYCNKDTRYNIRYKGKSRENNNQRKKDGEKQNEIHKCNKVMARKRLKEQKYRQRKPD